MFFKFLLYCEVLKFRLYQTFRWERIRKEILKKFFVILRNIFVRIFTECSVLINFVKIIVINSNFYVIYHCKIKICSLVIPLHFLVCGEEKKSQ